jgi:MSHA biogenesis protein MshP
MIHGPFRQHGFALIAGVFLIVVMAGLATTATVLSRQMWAQRAQEQLNTDAYWAAHAGLYHGLYQALQSGSCPGSTNLSPSDWGARFTVTITCSSTNGSDGGPITFYQVSATACNRAGSCPASIGDFYIERQLSAVVEAGATPKLIYIREMY